MKGLTVPPRKETEVVDKEKQGGGEPSAVTEPKPGELADQIASLGDSVAANQQAEQGTGDPEAQHSVALESMANIIDQTEIGTDEMVFDVRDFLLETIKSRPKPWSATSQGEQRDVAAACEHSAKELVRKIVEAVAAQGADPIRVLLTKVNASGDDIVITGKVKFLDAEPSQRDTAILSLHHGIGKHVMLTRASVDDYTGNGREAETQPDQNDFGFEAGSDEDESE
jgi:hypothetical protein